MNTVIEIENMEFHAKHGCYDLEKIVGNRFLVSVWIGVDARQAAENDDLSQSISYLTVYEVVREQMAVVSNILENVALRIIEAIYAGFPQSQSVRVKVSKLAPPLGGKVEKVSVVMER